MTATIIPIFLVIFVGWFARRKQFIPDGFLGPANRLVYYLGESGLARCAIFAGFISILQNILAVITFQLHTDRATAKGSSILVNTRRIVGPAGNSPGRRGLRYYGGVGSLRSA